MPTTIGIGFSQNTNTSQAAREAASRAKLLTQRSDINLALVFNTIHYDPVDVLTAVRETLDQAKIVGCTTAGIILPELVSMQGIAVMAVSSDEIQFGVGAVDDINTRELRDAGSHLAKVTIADFNQSRRQVFIAFIDGLHRNTVPIIQGLQEILGTVFPIIGAGTSDDFRFQKTHQYCQDKFFTHGAAGLLIGGPVHLGLGTKHGLKPLGKPRVIDRIDGHIIRTIDGKRASSIYEEYFGNEAKNLRLQQLSHLAVLYPLGIYIEEEKEYLIRNALDILKDGSIVCQGEVPQGSEVHIMIGSKDSCKQAAVDAALEIRESLQGKRPKFIIIFECIARHRLLGHFAFKEIQMIQEVLGDDIPLIGMYSFGEISPFHSLEHVKKIHLQNETIAILAVG